MRQRNVSSIVTCVLTAVLFPTACSRQNLISLSNPPVVGRSPDEQRIAWVQQVGDHRVAVSVNGQLDPNEYEIINAIVISPDGTRVAYPALGKGGWRMVLDGEEIGPACEAISQVWIAFSPDGRHLVYSARLGRRWFVIRDGDTLPGEGYDFVNSIVFSPDGTRFAYSVGEKSRQAVVENGEPGPYYFMTGPPVFSPDGKHLAYVAFDGDKRFIVLDGVPQKGWDEVNQPVFSSDGRHLVYSVTNGDKSFVMKDGVRLGREYRMTMKIDPIVFGPSDSRAAFVVFTGESWVAVIDGVEGPGYIDIIPDSILLSPDGRGYVYLAANGAGWFIMKDGRPGPGWDRVVMGDHPYSEDGKNCVYAAQKGKKWYLVIDGREGPPLDYLELSPEGGPNISPDGKYISYTAREHSGWHVVVNGQVGPAFDRLFKPAFKEEGVEYLAERESDGWLIHVVQPYPRPGKTKAGVVETKLSWLPKPQETEEECVPCKKQRQLLEQLGDRKETKE